MRPMSLLNENHAYPSCILPQAAAETGRHDLARDQAGAGRELVDDPERDGDPGRGVDHAGHGGYVPGELEQPVAVRGVRAVEAPDPELGGGAGDPGRPEPEDDGQVER